jgi:hypothetical protein
MSNPDYRGDHWVHERDYGSFEPGMFLMGCFLLLRGVIRLVMYIFRRKNG